MGDEDMLYPSRINIQPSHLFAQTIIIITDIYHDRCAVFRVFRVEEYVATHSRTQATHSSIQPVFSGLNISFPRYPKLMTFFWKFDAFFDIALLVIPVII